MYAITQGKISHKKAQKGIKREGLLLISSALCAFLWPFLSPDLDHCARCSTLSLEDSMRRTGHLIKICIFVAALITPALAQTAVSNDPIKTLVDRLDLEKYKATIKGLTQFGDRREGTERNRRAIDWIEQQLKSYGCISTERLTYNYQPEARSRAN